MKKIIHIVPRVVNSGPENVAKMLNSYSENEILITDTWSETKLKVKQLLKTDKDIVFVTHTLKPDIFAMLYIPQSNRISYIHCNFFEDYTMRYGKIKGSILSFIHNISVATGKYRVFVSKNAHNATLIKKHNDTVIYNGVVAEKNLSKQSNTKSKLFWIGSFIYRKNPNLFLKTVNKMLNDNLIKKEDIYMYGNHKNWNIDFFDMSYKSILRGFSNSPWENAQKNDILITTSKSEAGPSLVVLEAIVRKMKCIVPNIECFREIKKHPNIYYYEADSTNELAKTIEYVLKQPYEDYSEEYIYEVSSQRMIKEFISYTERVN